MRRGTVVWTRFSPLVHGLFCFALFLAQPFAQASSPFAGVGADGGSTDAVGAPPPKRGGFAPASDAVAAPGGETRSPAATDGLSAPATRAPASRKSFQPPTLMAPRVLGMYPNEFVQGTSYSVSLSGENLNPTLKPDFGAGILVKGAPVLLHGGKLKVSIDVLPFASTGKRKLKISGVFAPASEQMAEFEVKQKLVIAPEVKPKAKLVKLPETDLKQVFKGKILLDAPAWRKQVASQAAPKGPDGKPLGQPIPIYQDTHPTLDDTLLFIWHEQNKGLAERFEIRFFKGDKLLAKRDMVVPSGSGWGAVPHYRPDATLIGELFQALNKPVLQGNSGKFGRNEAKVDLMKTLLTSDQSVGTLEQEQALADVTWEVAGFRKYSKNGVAKSAQADLAEQPIRLAAGFAPKSKTSAEVPLDGYGHSGYGQLAKTEWVDKEVEISDRWPLYLPDAPTGLGCPEAVSAGLNVRNLDKATQNGKLAGASGYAYDRFTLEGSLNLADSPYYAQASKTQATIKPNPYVTVVTFTTWSFDNVFVDWGDGTQEPLAATVSGDAGDYERGATVDLLAEAGNHVHRYAGTGQYIVRVFQLGEDDIQGGAQQVAAWSTDVGVAQAGSGNLYNAHLAGGSQAAQAETEYGQAVAKRAYMVFCQPLTIQHRTDPAANGPLKLVDIAVEGVDSGGGLPKADAGKQGKVVSKAKAKTGDQGGGKGGAVASGGFANSSLTLEQAKSQFNALFLLAGVPAYTTCDYQLTPYGLLHYIGQGKVRTRWYVDGNALPADMPQEVGPSASRPDSVLSKPSLLWGLPLVSGVNLAATTPVGLDRLGLHHLRVEAEVVPDSLHLHGLVKAAQMGAASAQAALAQAAKEGALPKLGVLAVPKVPLKGGPGGGGPGPVINLMFNQPPMRLAAAGQSYTPQQSVSDVSKAQADTTPLVKNPPLWAVSEEQPYQVVGSDPTQPCTFDFPVTDGKFKVVGLQAPGGKPKVTRQGDRYSGSGKLLVPIPGGGAQTAPVGIKNWKVAEDGLTVLDGQFSITSPGLPELPMPAVKGRFTRLDGVAGDRVEAWLDARLVNSDLKESASASIVPHWNGIKATLTPDGDWYAAGLTMPEFLVYDSGARIKPQSVVLDLSAKQGASPSAKCEGGNSGGGGDAWRGVSLGTSDLFLFNFDMPDAPPKAVVSDWGVDGGGLCGGPATTDAKTYAWLLGQIGWDGISAWAEGGLFQARYQGLWVHAPWLDVTLGGAGDLIYKAGKGQGQSGGITLALSGDAKTLTHGPVTLRAENLSFTMTPLGPGANAPSLPAVNTDTCFDFKGESQVFAKDICVNDLYFAFDGKAYFQGAAAKTVSLAGKSGKLAQGTVSLKEVKIDTSSGGGQRLRFDFLTDLGISQALPAVPVPVSYQVKEAAAQYTGSGPLTGSFEVKFTSSLVNATIHPSYTGPTDGTSVASNPVMLALADLGYESDAPFMVALGSGDTIVFKGDADLTQFEMDLPLHGTFLLGYHGSTDFWATKFTMQPVPGGIVLVPGVLHLFEFGGGLGYHVTEDSLIGDSLDNVQFSSDGVPVVNATALVGTGFDKGFTFSARGELNIKPGSGAVKMKPLTAWLLTNDHTGTGPINGDLSYGGGVFSGNLGGNWGPPGLDQYIYIEADPGAIGFSIGAGDWYYRVGSQGTPVKGYFFGAHGDAWFDLNSAGGLHIGARANARFPDIACDGGTCARVMGDVWVNAGVQLSPIQLDAQGGAKVSAKACLGGCIELSPAVSVHVAAPNPLELGFGYELNACPLGKLKVNMEVLPVVKPGVSPELCSLGDIAGAAGDIAGAVTGVIGEGAGAIGGAAEDIYDGGKKALCSIFC